MNTPKFFISRDVLKNTLLKSLPILSLLLASLTLFISPSIAQEGSLLFKNYLVRYDRGWDVLCEPYVVKRDDWVLKIFRKKGEIANKDFREFSGIFMRINPHIKDINTIRPGQRIDIPLKKIRKGTFAGQETGVVTIPFVSLTSVEKLIKKESEAYLVKKGDTLSRLLIDRFGDYGSKSYKEGVKLFQKANPTVKNLDLIYAGQKLSLPDASIREKKWYSSIYDQSGKIIGNITPKRTPIYPAPAHKSSFLSHLNEEKKGGPIADAANAMDARFHNKGTYYFPIKGQKDFELDISRYPIIDIGNGKKYIITNEDTIMGVPIATLQSRIKNIEIIKVDKNKSAEQILDAIFQSTSQQVAKNGLTVRDQGIEVFVKAKWIKPKKQSQTDEKKYLCITPIASNNQRTPDSIRRFLNEHNVELKEVVSNTTVSSKNVTSRKIQSLPKRPKMIMPQTQKQFVKDIFTAMGFHFSPNVDISFPYAGIQVKAFSNLLSSSKGKSTLVDFGELYGDAISSIKKTGLNVIRIATKDNPDQIVHKLLNGLSIPFSNNPSYLAAERADEFNITIKISGLIVENSLFEKTLLSQISLHPEIVDFLNKIGIKVIIFG